jgi:hypothetical protein
MTVHATSETPVCEIANSPVEQARRAGGRGCVEAA